MGKLTFGKLKALSEPGMFGDGGTLFLKISPGGSKSWVQRITIKGKRHDVGLGGWPVVSLQEARERAFENRRAVAHGRDPLVEKKQAIKESTVPTFRGVARQYYEENLPRWKSGRHTERWMQVVEKYAFPVFGDVPVNRVGREDMLRMLTPIWTAKPEHARKLRQRVRLILDWCQAHGYVHTNIAGEQISGALPSMPSVKEHHRSLPYGEVSRALDMIEESGASLSAKLCLRFLILTAVRPGEARNAMWDEINWETKTWTIPASKMKAKAEHRVPLSREALKVLERASRVRGESPLVFPSSLKRAKPMSDMTLTKLLRDVGLGEKTVPHGFRSSFRTWAGEQTNTPTPVIELCLAHSVGNAIEKAYARSDLLSKRRTLMQRWSDYISKKCAEVVVLHQ
ncbi:MAG: tyrosine-type recombinase/integrase [Nitrospira sp.]|nr:tyrosine-type recombinase/integrase [Nitrospira sp.]MDE0505646.1 tyrosine-type recombinase/integrase [Candidatus Poribacteria bacterium]